MPITIFSNQCTTCGLNGTYISRVKAAYPEAIVVNTKYDADQRQEHLNYLLMAGMTTETYTPIVVEDGVITRLDQWKPSSL